MKPVYTNINMQPGATRHGIVSVQVAPREWLITSPVIDFNTGRVKTAVVFIAGRDWITLEFTPLSYDYEEKDKTSKAGPLYQLNLTGTFNNYDADVQQVIESLRYHELIAVVIDKQKRKKIAGTKDVGFVPSLTNKNQNTSGGKQIVTYDLVMQSEKPAPYYDV